jgi:RNA polymerase sigma-70 factor, ECF subfamily
LESDLIRRAQAGDDDAYTALVRQHEDVVFRLAYLIVRDAEDAADVAQDAFIRAHRHLGQFDASRPLRPWLLRIAANLARNRRRTRGRYAAMLGRVFNLAPRVAPSAESENVQVQQSEALWQAVHRLDQRDQEVIYLRYMLDLSVEETAQILDVRPGTVKSRLSRALDRLRAVVVAEFPLLTEGRQV